MSHTNGHDTPTTKSPLFAIGFIDHHDKHLSRITPDVDSITITETTTGRVAGYKITDLPRDVLDMLAIAGAKKVIETHIRGALNKDDATNVIDRAGDIWQCFLEGSIYMRKASATKTPRAKKDNFDAKFWGEVSRDFMKRKTHLEPSHDKVSDFVAKLQAKTPKERKETIARFTKSDPHFKAAYLATKATRASKDAPVDANADLFEMMNA